MRILGLLILAIGLMMSTPSEVFAQNYNRIFSEISDMNRIDPMQNPGYARSDEILGRRIFDNTNKVIGEVKDVIVKANGAVASLNVEFSRLHLRAPVFLDYRIMNIRTVTDGYILGQNAREIKAQYPSILSNIETASGSDADSYSVEKLIGAQVYTENGQRIGQVDDLLFNDRGGYVEALYIDMTYKTLRSAKLAFPFDRVQIENSYGQRRFIISETQAEALIQYTRNDR